MSHSTSTSTPMRIFVTGASGYVGGAVVKELLAAGHSVLALARNEGNDTTIRALAGDDKAKAARLELLRGSLQDIASLQSGASKADGVIHCGFIHDFTQFVQNCATDRAAIEAMCTVLAKAGGNKPFVMTSGVGTAHQPGSNCTKLTEDMPPSTEGFGAVRGASETVAQKFVSQGVRVIVVRLPLVHGPKDHGFIPMFTKTFKDAGAAAYIGDGQAIWSGVHINDAALLYRLAVERAAAGAVLNAVGTEGITQKDLVSILGKRLGIPVKSIEPADAEKYYGFLHFFALVRGVAASSAKTQSALGWKPVGPKMGQDVDSEVYFPKD